MTFIVRSVIGWASFAAIAAALWWTGAVRPLLYGMLALCAVFVAGCYLAPGLMTRLISMPHTFRVDRNLGRAGLELQSVTYAAYHTHWFARMTHHGFALDGLAWMTFGWLAVGPWIALPMIAWSIVQGRTFAEPRFTAALTGLWIVTLGVAGALIAALGPAMAFEVAACVLLTNALWRVVGHTVEPVPPDLVDNPTFATVQSVGFDLRLGRAALLGVIAEFAAGLPYRLGVFWLYRQMLRLGWRPATQIDRASIESQAEAVHHSGWDAAPATRGLS